MTKLLGCPFCGGKATTYEYQSRYLAQCDSCSFALTPEEWNRRAESDREAVLTHQLELRVQELDATADILEQTRRENADLLAALRELVRLSGHSALDDDCPVCVATANARAAIARYEK